MTAKETTVAWRAEAARSGGVCREVRDRKIGMAPRGSWMTRSVVKVVAERS